MDIIKSKHMIVGGLIVSGMLLTTPTFAASNCKGMAQTDCNGSTSCRWIDSYTRKDGKTINAYCRSNPNGKVAEKKVVEKKGVEKKGANEADKNKTAS